MSPSLSNVRGLPNIRAQLALKWAEVVLLGRCLLPLLMLITHRFVLSLDCLEVQRLTRRLL